MAHYTFANLNLRLLYDSELRRIYPLLRREIILSPRNGRRNRFAVAPM